MKKFLSIIMMAVMAATLSTLTSCNPKLEKIKQAIAEAKKQLPTSMGSVGTFTSIDLDEDADAVVFSYEIKTELVKSEVFRNHEEMMKRSLLLQMDMDDSAMDLIQECADAGLALTLNLSFDDGTSPVEITVTPDEVNSTAHMTEEEARTNYLQNMADMTKLQLPLKGDEVTTWVDMKFEDGYLVYIYRIDENINSISNLRMYEDQLRETLATNLHSSSEPTLKYMLGVCKEANVGLKYEYDGSITGEKLVFTFTSGEL